MRIIKKSAPVGARRSQNSAAILYLFDKRAFAAPKFEFYIPYIDYAEIAARVGAAKKSPTWCLSICSAEARKTCLRPPHIRVSLAQYIADLGVDVIIGHHPHVVQPITWLGPDKDSGDTLCIYSLGNIVSLMVAPYNMGGRRYDV